MSKTLIRLALAVLATSLCARAAAAQTTLEWIVLSPAREGFTVRMPKQPVTVEQGVQAHGLNAFGFRYSAAPDDATTFVVWTMKGSHARGPLGGGDRAITFSYGVAPYLDGVAELAWELLVTPEYERLERKGITGRRLAEMGLGMTYRRGFELSGLPAREYSVTLEGERGHVYVCSEGPQVYVVAALGADAGDARLRQFVDSFALKSAKPSTPAVGGDPVGKTGAGAGSVGNVGSTVPPAGPAAPVDYTRPFRQIEVAKKAVLTFKPEPGFTEEARRFGVTGVVRLRAILHTSGELRNIVIIKGLPHGLTEKSIAAARQIRFEPAQKDGRQVSQYVVLEYNYNIY
ncbi:MAG TPA: TonB family protein [Pyrinomonadaceae bacterium]|jgi:TonB family protein